MFINLRTFSDYSIGQSVIKLSDLAKHCHKKNIPAIALTDYNNLFGSLEFSLECIKVGVQPIIGAIITINVGTEDNKNLCDILLLSKSRCGYENLMKLITTCYLNDSVIPHITLTDLFDNSDGLILLSGNNGSPIEKLFNLEKKEEAKKLIELFNYNFQNNFYLELSRSDNYFDYEFDKFIKNIALEKNIPIVATNPTQYISQTMQDALDTLICITTGRYLIEEERNKANPEAYLKSSRQMKKLFADIPEAIKNTEIIAKKCTFILQESKPLLPKFFTTKQQESEELIRQSKEGLDIRLKTTNYDIQERKLYFERLDYELSVINKMEFGGYFLIVSDFIKWSKKQQIPVGPGRGSGAGSIVAWSLQISDIDPIKFGLLFERFLNPERVSMPDFDIDFCQERRDEVINYVKKKFGEDKVAHIITFGKLQARAVLRDVGRVLQIPYMQVDKICKMVPSNPANPVTLKQAIDMDRELKFQSKNDPSIEKLTSISLKLEGVNRHISTHAAGIVIGNKELLKIVPLYKDSNSTMPMVQYSLKYAEKIGLVKFDFLGLKTLTVISWTCNLINKINKDFDLQNIPLDDKKTYKMLSQGNCIGVFQFESSGMRETIKKIKPDNIGDLIALGSLYRPGPMDNIPSYINRKHGTEEIDYVHPLLETVLKETYGIIVYQEQVMEIAQILAKYTLGEADLLRRAMGKKIKEEMEAQRSKFITGCTDNNINKEKAEEIFNLVNKFASYGFNKSHAAAYAYISFQTAYLKANYPLEFIASSINLEIDNTDKIYLFIIEAKKFGIHILLPDVNYSKSEFSIENNKIRFGLTGLKGVGKKVIDLMVAEREKNGKYIDIFDFIERLSDIGINKKILENLINSGAFDEFGISRKTLFMNIDILLKHSISNTHNDDQLDLFFDTTNNSKYRPDLKHYTEWNEKEKLKVEFESFGYYISTHPIEKYKCFFDRLNISQSTDIEKIQSSISKIKLLGVLTVKKIRSTPRGKYAFLQISDLNGIIDLAIFDESLLYKSNDLLVEGNSLYFSAEVRKDNSGVRIIVNNISTIDQSINDSNVQIKIMIKEQKHLEYLKKTIDYTSGIKINLSAQNEAGDIVYFKQTKNMFIDLSDLHYFQKNKLIEI